MATSNPKRQMSPKQRAAAKERHAKLAQQALRRPTKAQQTKFLELIRAGMDRSQAGAAVGSTGSRFKALTDNPDGYGHDPVFAAAYQDARAEGAEKLADELGAEAVHRQLGGDPMSKSDRGLHNERIFRDPAYRAAHRQQHEHTGANGEKLEVVLAFLGKPE